MKAKRLTSLRVLSRVLLLSGAAFGAGTAAANGQIAATSKPTPIAASAPTAVPTLIPYSGMAIGREGEPLPGETAITFLIFKEEQGGEPVWMETQTVSVDGSGHYQVQLGAGSPGGMPTTTFASGEGRWLEVQIGGQQAKPRVLLASVPYAMKSAEAETLGGLTAQSFVTQAQLAETAKDLSTRVSPLITPFVTPSGSGTTNTIPIWTSSTALGNSLMTQSGANINIGSTTTPASLGVNGNISNSASGTYTNFTSSAYNSLGYGGPRIAFNRYEGTLAAPAAVKLNDTIGWFDFYGYDGSAGQRAGELTMYADGTPTAGVVPGRFEIETASSTGADTPRITAYSNDNVVMSTHGGKVGIGTAAPAAVLEVNGTAKFDGNITFASTQTFPITGTGGGTITGITTTSPLTGSGTSGSVALGLNTSTLETTLNGVYPQLSATTNAFKGGASFTGPITAASSSGNGVYGSTNENGAGVLGTVASPVSQDSGVTGIDTGASVVGNTYEITSGVWGDVSAASNGTLWNVGVMGSADNGQAGVFLNNSAEYPTLVVMNYSSGGATGLFKTFMAKSAEGTCGIGSGSMSCTGPIKSLASSGPDSTVETYSVQSPENWMEDFGSGNLQNGVALITVDPGFGKTVTGDASYHVFLTPNGDSKGLYVISKTATTFEVRESGGGTSTLSFDYRIVAKRRGYETQRLVDVTERFNGEMKAATMRKAPEGRKPATLARKKSGLELAAERAHKAAIVPVATRTKPAVKP